MIMVDELIDYGMKIGRNGPQWCHLTTDGDLLELHRFAKRIGMRRDYCSDVRQPGVQPIHYDLTAGMRVRALKAGAVFVPALKQARERLHLQG